MNTSRGITAVALLITLMACTSSGGLQVLAIEGIWIADAIVYTDNANPDTAVDIFVRDGASWLMTVGDVGGVAVTFDDGLGNVVNIWGVIDEEVDFVVIDGVEYVVVLASNRLTFTNADQMFQFDPSGGPVPATIRIELSRI